MVVSALTRRMSLRESVLDSLADDGESVIQIENYLKYLGMEVNRQQLISIVIELLEQETIKVVYPPGIGLAHIKSASINIEDFWFEQTETGRNEWNKIDT